MVQYIYDALYNNGNNTDIVISESGNTSVNYSEYTIIDDTNKPNILLETSFDEYSVSDGLLLIIVIILYLCGLWIIIKNGFKWFSNHI